MLELADGLAYLLLGDITTEKRYELISAKAGHKALLEGLLHGPGKGQQHLIAHLMTKRIIDMLEKIDIQHDQGERFLLLAMAENLLRQYLFQLIAVIAFAISEIIKKGLPTI